jgi:RNA binding exosome subunit
MGLLALHFRTYCHETEDPAKVRQAVSFITGGGEVEEHSTEGHHGNRIVVMESHIRDRKGVRAFFARLCAEDLEELLRTLGMRVDDEGNLYIRFDKQAAFQGSMRMGQTDDPIVVRGKIESYPRNRENDIASAKAFLEAQIGKRIN